MNVNYQRKDRTAPVVVVGGGQSGLAAARALRQLDQPALVLEAGDRPAGSWPRYYDSLRLFSPAGFSAMPGMPFGGDDDEPVIVAADRAHGRASADLDVERGGVVLEVVGDLVARRVAIRITAEGHAGHRTEASG